MSGTSSRIRFFCASGEREVFVDVGEAVLELQNLVVE